MRDRDSESVKVCKLWLAILTLAIAAGASLLGIGEWIGSLQTKQSATDAAVIKLTYNDQMRGEKVSEMANDIKWIKQALGWKPQMGADASSGPSGRGTAGGL